MNRKQFHPFFFSQGFCHFSQGFALPEQKSWSKKLEQKSWSKKVAFRLHPFSPCLCVFS